MTDVSATGDPRIAHQITVLKGYRDQAIQQHVSMSGWLVASLLAINGGAAVAVMNNARMPATPWTAAFFVGIIVALLCAWAIRDAALELLTPANEEIDYWLTVQNAGEPNEDEEKRLKANLAHARRRAHRATVLGLLSALSFAVGAIGTAHVLTAADAANAPICAAIQDRFLTEARGRADNVAMFTAMGCRLRAPGR